MAEQATALVPPSEAELRERLVNLVESNLLGPAGGEHEILGPRESPRDRYLLGVVAPAGTWIEPEADEGVATATELEEESGDEDEAGQSSLFPASIGLTFRVEPTCEQLEVTATWGQYLRVDSPNGEGKVWQREPRGGTVLLELAEGQRVLGSPDPEAPDVRIESRVRRVGQGWTVTLFLRNDQSEPVQNRDQAWLFQAGLHLRDVAGGSVFASADPVSDLSEEELRRLSISYRNRLEFAVGHGIAVHALVDPDNPTRAARLATRALPRAEVSQVRPPSADDETELRDLELDMRRLGEAGDDELPRLLGALPEAYGRWIEEQAERLARGEDGLQPGDTTAIAMLEEARQARDRIEAGIALLRENPHARDAFRFANRAMALQRLHSRFAEHRRRGGKRTPEELDTPEERSWYPFQLGFILLCLPSATDPTHPDRSHPTQAICDLLWFPTGGGKTEAYLGLAAYVIALRRLQGRLGGRRADAGVAVLMRYTLRVLTLQQFQRASALICACEVLRREDLERWGSEPFRIGLWVGHNTTPNRVDIASEALKNLSGDGWRKTGGGRPDQLASCPWCGSRIDPGRHMRVETYERGRCRVLTFCGDDLGQCEFSERKSPVEGLPVLTVDEEIYRRLPTLLIATVDKFAQLPWKGETQALFGVVDGRCERHGFRTPSLKDSDSHPKRGSLPPARTVERGTLLRPPDLVIQDELHLISGPLGSMVALYETAVDELMTWELDGTRVRPKVVASTATVRRARDQARQLFLRDLRVFPPPGLDTEDSFFARERDVSEEDPGRLYIGVCAPGRRLKAVLIRTYVAFLAAAQSLYQEFGQLADPWMTLVGYFNAMQELAGMRRMCEDDVRTRLGKTDRWGLAKRRLGPTSIRELTSRLNAGDIPDVLDHMEVAFDPEAEERRKKGDRSVPRRPLDVLLATNMISVGVDVGRLGLMVVAGQPKTTAEYIQATGRVGRREPGIVCTVYNWARPRDLSHYERFEHYHDTLYRQVEPLSVTPFAPRALDRGLSALLVALLRLSGLAYNPNASARELVRESEICRRALDAIQHRAQEATTRAEIGEHVRELLEGRVDEWLARVEQTARTGAKLGYQEERDSDTIGLLSRPAPGTWDRFTALNSLRNVEPSVGLVLRDGALFPGTER